MRKTTVLTCIVFVAFSRIAWGAQYRGSFETAWNVTAFGSTPATAIIEATTDGNTFRVDSLSVHITTSLVGTGSWSDTTMDPVATSINLFTDEQALEFIANTDIASIESFPFYLDYELGGIIRQGSTLTILDESQTISSSRGNITTVFDFGQPDEIAMTFSRPPNGWSLFGISVPGHLGVGTQLIVPTETVILRVVPEPSAFAIASGLGLLIAVHWRQRRQH